MGVTPLSIQEAAAAFANSIVANLNSSIANTMGITVMWFRLQPDKRSQDVIFQSYTLFGVDDCPLEFNAMYSDTGYDDAAITYNIMGLEYSVPLTLEIPVNTWYSVTNADGTLPQRGDIVFIPISNKLVEVVSMTPVKSTAAQITAFKVNCSIYKPTRSRIVGENLRTSIENNTVNLESRFGKDIDDTFENVVDDPQLSGFSSTSEDIHKAVTKYSTVNTLLTDRQIRNIVSEDLIVDGHTYARTYYDMKQDVDIIVKYLDIKDKFKESETRAYSCWINLNDYPGYKNIKRLDLVKEDNEYFIDILEYSGKRLPSNTYVVLERGNIVLPCKVANTEQYRLIVDNKLIKGLNRAIPNWITLLGYTIREDNVINLLSGETSESNHFEINLRANNYIEFILDENIALIQLPVKLKTNLWYGIILNISDMIAVDIYEADTNLKKVCGLNNAKIRFSLFNEYVSYYIKSSECKLTNIRYFDSALESTDKQIINLVSYNTPVDAHAIINDSADTYLNKPYLGYDG